jgi:hypothetical protein
MARQGINTGTSPNDGLGDSLLTGAIKINSNFSEIYNTFGDGNNLVSYSNSSGISTYSNISGVSTYSITSGIATYSPTSGVSTYASIAGYSTSSGISTVSQGLTGTPNLNVGVVTATSYIGSGSNLTGVITSLVAGSNVTITQSSGIATISASGSGGGGSGDYSIIAGYSTSSGISTVAQGLTGTPSINVYNVGVASAINVGAASTFQKSVHFESTLLIGDTDELQIFHDGNNSYIDNSSVGNLIIRDSGTGIQLKKTSGALMGVFNNDAGVELYYNGVLKFQTFQNGVAINESVGIGSTAGNPPYRLTVSGVGATITQGLANAIADFTSSVNGYGQVNVRNSLSGANASGDIVVTANSGTDTSNFIDLGINNAGFTTTSWTINGALDGYLYTSDGNLSIGAASASKYLSLFAGGTLAANEQVRVTSTGVGIGTTNPTSKLTVTGDVNITGVVTATSFSGSGSGLTNIPSGQLTGALPAIDGSALTGIVASSTGVNIRDDGSSVGTATTIDFGANLSVSFASGTATITGSSGGGSQTLDTTLGLGNTSSLGMSVGVVTATEFIGGGSDLRNLPGTHLVSYASHSETSNSALSIAGSSFNQVGILTGSLASASGDNFGYSVATSADGKTIIVGAYNDEQTGSGDSSGVVYVYDRIGSSFNQVGILTGSLAVNSFDYFGWSVATSADGKTIIVGAYGDEQTGSGDASGVVYVFDRVGNSFNQVGILTGSLASDDDDRFGYSVTTSADGKTIVVGASRDEQTGSGSAAGVVYVFDRIGNSFNQVGILTGSLAVDASDNFGWSVATSADGKTIVVGVLFDEQAGSGASSGVVYVYDRVGNSFNQVGILTGSLAVNSGDFFGYSVATSADGKTIVVGARSDEIGATTGTGVVYVYDRVGNSFNQVGILTGSLAVDSDDWFGYSVATSADGKTIVVNAYQDEQTGSGASSGVVYIFKRQGNSFNQVGILTGSLAVDASDNFGRSVAISADGKTIIVGASSDEIGATTGTGVVYVFDETRNTYVHSGPTGNIGIGTTNATSKLTIGGDVIITGITTVGLANTSTPPSNSQMSFELTSNTNLRIKVRGTDGVLRSANITLA